jgi:hypothetical protein
MTRARPEQAKLDAERARLDTERAASPTKQRCASRRGRCQPPPGVARMRPYLLVGSTGAECGYPRGVGTESLYP